MAAVSIFLSLLFLSSISQLSDVAAWQLEEHDYEAGAVSPAMATFFGGDGNGVTTPVAENSSTVPKWRLPSPEQKQEGNRNSLRTAVILGVGVVCGVVGIGLLVAAAVAYGAHVRRSRSKVRLGAV